MPNPCGAVPEMSIGRSDGACKGDARFWRAALFRPVGALVVDGPAHRGLTAPATRFGPVGADRAFPRAAPTGQALPRALPLGGRSPPYACKQKHGTQAFVSFVPFVVQSAAAAGRCPPSTRTRSSSP